MVPKIAAIAAQEHGDIRKAINLLRATGEIAEEKGTKIREEYIDMAHNLIESNEINNLITSLPLQARYVLMALCNSIKKLHAVDVAASTIYEEYLDVVRSYGAKDLPTGGLQITSGSSTTLASQSPGFLPRDTAKRGS